MNYRTTVKTLCGMVKSYRRLVCLEKARFTPAHMCELSLETLKSKHCLPGN